GALADGDVPAGAGGDGRVVRDADDLVGLAEFLHQAADPGGRFAGDAGVDFVEDERGDAVAGGQDGLDGEHGAGEFATGGGFLEGLPALADIGGEQELDVITAGGAAFGQGADF